MVEIVPSQAYDGETTILGPLRKMFFNFDERDRAGM
jgi:hypothetical protein